MKEDSKVNKESKMKLGDGFKTQLVNFPAVRPWTNHLTSLNFIDNMRNYLSRYLSQGLLYKLDQAIKGLSIFMGMVRAQ